MCKLLLYRYTKYDRYHYLKGETMTVKQPQMLTIRQVAKTGILSEHALRIMLKAGKLPAIYVGNKALINYDKLCEQLSALEADTSAKTVQGWC